MVATVTLILVVVVRCSPQLTKIELPRASGTMPAIWRKKSI